MVVCWIRSSLSLVGVWGVGSGHLQRPLPSTLATLSLPFSFVPQDSVQDARLVLREARQGPSCSLVVAAVAFWSDAAPSAPSDDARPGWVQKVCSNKKGAPKPKVHSASCCFSVGNPSADSLLARAWWIAVPRVSRTFSQPASAAGPSSMGADRSLYSFRLKARSSPSPRPTMRPSRTSARPSLDTCANRASRSSSRRSSSCTT